MKKLVLSLISISTLFAAYSQQGDGGTPKSGKITVDSKSIDRHKFSTPDIEALKAEDLVNDDSGTAPWRFGYNNYTNLNMLNSGSWSTLPNGDKIWRIELVCENALTVNLTFSDLKIPEGNELYVYNPSKDFILGKFTEYHLYMGKLGTELIPGNTAIVEYYIPYRNASIDASLTVNTVTHGYRTASEFIEKAFGGSGSCNMNVNCADGAAWTNQRNGAIMLVSGSSGFCSGSLINNVLNDGKPYVLTANHCYSDPTSWIFRFNWQSADCNNPGSSPTFNSLSGAVLRSRRTPSDFCLVEITGGLVGGSVPTTYNPYFSGWDNSGVPPTSSVSIHHPSGDIKKISFDDAAAVAVQAMGSSEANSSWQVEWDRNTTTEGGSSGSPLFDQNHRIIGQLWGGGASCSNLSAPDYYGRVSNSWAPAGSNSTNQLKYWLDPNSTGATFIDGYDPLNSTPLALDAALSNPQGVSGTHCDGQITPSITITNSGTTTLTSATVEYGFDGTLDQVYNWSGSLAQYQSATINLPTFTLSGGSHTFDAEVTNPNSGVDENLVNDALSSSFTTITDAQILDLDLDIDCWGSETSWELSNQLGDVLYSGGGYADDDAGLIEQSFCLSYGCYNFKIMDSYGDGMTSCSVADGGNGYYTLTYNSEIVAEIDDAGANFGFENIQNFCLIDDSGLDEKSLEKTVQVYPNPANEFITIKSLDGAILSLEFMNIAGQVLSSQNVNNGVYKLDLTTIASGVYMVRIHTEKGSLVKQVVVK